MEIEKLNLALQTVSQNIELFGRKTPFRSVRFWTENTVKITNIRYFKIATCYHLFRLIKALCYEYSDQYKVSAPEDADEYIVAESFDDLFS